MDIKEQFIMGKQVDQQLCEDGLFVNDSFIAVLDGVTSKGNKQFNNMSGGRAVTNAAITVLQSAPKDICKTELFKEINNTVASLYEDAPSGEAAVCLIVYSSFYKELWVVGDCQCIINSTLHTHEKLIDRELSGIRAGAIEQALSTGFTIEEIMENDIGRQAILPRLKEQHQFANRTDHKYGYPVINGSRFDPDSIISYTLEDGDVVALATDGYPKLFNTLDESESYLEHIIATDPLCFREYKSTKGLQKNNISFDDRTYIKFCV